MGLENGSRERSVIGCVDAAEGMGVRGYAARNVSKGSVFCLESETQLLRGTWGGEAATAPTCQLLSPWALGETPTRVNMPQSVATVCCFCNCRKLEHTPIVAAVPFPGFSEYVCPKQPFLLLPLTWARNRCLRVVHMQRWDQNQR